MLPDSGIVDLTAPTPVIRTAIIKWDTTNKRTAVELSVTSVEDAMDILCEGMIVILRTAHKRGASNPDMQEHLNRMKLKVWNGLLDNLDNPDVHEVYL